MMTPDDDIRRYRNDILYAIAAGVIASGFVLYDSIRRIAELFSTPGAISARAPLPEQPITAEIGDGTRAVADSAMLIVEGVNTVSIVCLVLSIALSAVGLILAAVLAVTVCIRLLRGQVFDRTNTRLLTGVSLALAAAALCDMAFRTMGLNGLFAAAGGEFDAQQNLFYEQLPLFGAAFAVGLLGIIFRRGTTLQREAEGLV